jgi:hypothetical protein
MNGKLFLFLEVCYLEEEVKPSTGSSQKQSEE